MQEISANEFKEVVELDPAWASKLTEPVKIWDYCDMGESEITHLSPLLYFMEPDMSANFEGCFNLKVATGNFAGMVNFGQTEIEEIKDLTVKGTCEDLHESANFMGCDNLKVANGKFEGHVCFSHSGVEKIGNLQIKKPNRLRLFCSLDGTPLEKLDVIQAVTTMTGKREISLWESVLKRIKKGDENVDEDTLELLGKMVEEACKKLKAIKTTVETLQETDKLEMS